MSADWAWLSAYSAAPPPPPGSAQAQANIAAVNAFYAGTATPGNTPPPGPQPGPAAGTPQQQQGQLSPQQQRQLAQQQAANQRKMERGIRAFQGTRARIRAMPTPGGLGILVLILVLLLFFLVAVNGKQTRAELLMDVALGEASLPPEGTGTGSGPFDPNDGPPPDTDNQTGATANQAQPQSVQSGLIAANVLNADIAVGAPTPWDYSPSGVPMPGVQVTAVSNG